MGQNSILVGVHVTPKAGRNQVSGIATDDGGRTEGNVRVTAAPEGGKANKAVCETVARALGIARGRVSVVRGDTSRHKMIAIEADQATVDEWLASLPPAK